MFADNLGSLLPLWSVRYLWLFAQLFLPPSPLWFITFCFSSVQCNNVERVYLYNRNRLLWRLSLCHKYRSGSFGWRMSYKGSMEASPAVLVHAPIRAHHGPPASTCMHNSHTCRYWSRMWPCINKSWLVLAPQNTDFYPQNREVTTEGRGEVLHLEVNEKEISELKEMGEINWGKVEDSSDAPKLLFPLLWLLHPHSTHTVKIFSSCRTLQELQSPRWSMGTNQPYIQSPCLYLPKLF